MRKATKWHSLQKLRFLIPLDWYHYETHSAEILQLDLSFSWRYATFCSVRYIQYIIKLTRISLGRCTAKINWCGCHQCLFLVTRLNYGFCPFHFAAVPNFPLPLFSSSNRQREKLRSRLGQESWWPLGNPSVKWNANDQMFLRWSFGQIIRSSCFARHVKTSVHHLIGSFSSFSWKFNVRWLENDTHDRFLKFTKTFPISWISLQPLNTYQTLSKRKTSWSGKRLTN